MYSLILLKHKFKKNVTMAPDKLSATLQYGDKSVILPTTKGKEAAEAAVKAAQ